MTGSGVAQGPTELGDLTVEVRSVNGRNLVVKMRLPGECAGLEAALEMSVRTRLRRGTVTVAIDVVNPARAPVVDGTAFGRAAEELAELAARHGLGAVALGDVLAVPGVLQPPAGARMRTSREPSPEVTALLQSSLDRLIEVRAAEGESTARAMLAQLDALETALDTVVARSPAVVGEHRERLIARVNEFLEGRARALSDEDVIRELGLFADRIDVTEEVERLRAHAGRLRRTLEGGGEVGRDLEFLMQEMLREVNTVGSKSPDVTMSHLAVDMKSSVERLREQSANLE